MALKLDLFVQTSSVLKLLTNFFYCKGKLSSLWIYTSVYLSCLISWDTCCITTLMDRWMVNTKFVNFCIWLPSSPIFSRTLSVPPIPHHTHLLRSLFASFYRLTLILGAQTSYSSILREDFSENNFQSFSEMLE